MPTKGYRTAAERREAGYPQRRDPVFIGIGSLEKMVQMSFGEQVVEALNEHIDARIGYAETRRGPSAEYANPDEMNKTGERLQALLDKVRFAL